MTILHNTNISLLKIFRFDVEKQDLSVQYIRKGTREIEVDGLSVYRCSLWDPETYETKANLLFYIPGCRRAPSGPVIKTRTSQHSTMEAPLIFTIFFFSAKDTRLLK